MRMQMFGWMMSGGSGDGALVYKSEYKHLRIHLRHIVNLQSFKTHMLRIILYFTITRAIEYILEERPPNVPGYSIFFK